MADDDKVYMPRQLTKRGKAGYKGKNVVIVERDGKTQTPANADKKTVTRSR